MREYISHAEAKKIISSIAKTKGSCEELVDDLRSGVDGVYGCPVVAADEVEYYINRLRNYVDQAYDEVQSLRRCSENLMSKE